MAGARDELERLIRQTEEELRALKLALRSFERRASAGKADGRFIDFRPLDAIRVVLAERGGSMPRAELEQALLEGGIAIGKKRAHHNVRISIDLNIRIHNLEEKDGVVSLPSSQSQSQGQSQS